MISVFLAELNNSTVIMVHLFIFQSDYLALADQLSEYVVRLLDKVRGHDELEKLLNKKKREPDDETYEQLSRLKLAIHYSEKKVSDGGQTSLAFLSS